MWTERLGAEEAREAHNLEVAGSKPAAAKALSFFSSLFFFFHFLFFFHNLFVFVVVACLPRVMLCMAPSSFERGIACLDQQQKRLGAEEAREAHNLEVVGSKPTAANS